MRGLTREHKLQLQMGKTHIGSECSTPPKIIQKDKPSPQMIAAVQRMFEGFFPQAVLDKIHAAQTNGGAVSPIDPTNT